MNCEVCMTIKEIPDLKYVITITKMSKIICNDCLIREKKNYELQKNDLEKYIKEKQIRNKIKENGIIDFNELLKKYKYSLLD